MLDSPRLEKFFEDFTQSIRLSQELTGMQYEEQLYMDVADYMMDAGEIEESMYDHYESPDSKMRIDGWGGTISDDGQLRLFSVVTNQSSSLQMLSKREMESEFNKMINFVTACKDASFVSRFDRVREIRQLAEEINVNWKSISKLRLSLVTDKRISQRLDGLPARSVENIEVVHSVWDIQRLAEIVASGRGREALTVRLKEDFGLELPALQASSEFAAYDAYLLVVPGEILARIYDRYDTRLLESNVRVFLQARGGVNKGIRDTIENFPEKFLAYNNGITATASGVEKVELRGQLLIDTINDLQIVNGGQTTASIHSAYRRKVDLSKVFVQMKLSVIGEVADDELVSDISKYANSQNKVSEADFFSNHPYHKRLENFSRDIFAPSVESSFVRSKWFYERARGQYLDMLARAKNRKRAESEYPKKQLITKTDHAKYEMTFAHQPQLVSKGAQHNFKGFASDISKRWESNDADFDRRHFECSIARAILFRAGERIVSDSSWYDGGYRAQAVTYTWAKIAFDVHNKGKQLNFQDVWQCQAVPSVVSHQFHEIAKHVYRFLFEPVPGISNIGELAKREDCWNRLKGKEFNYSNEFLGWCIDPNRPSKRDRTVAKNVSVTIRYNTVKPNEWEQLFNYCRSEGIQLTPTEHGVIRCRIDNKIVTDAQARVIKGMYQRISKQLPDRFIF